MPENPRGDEVQHGTDAEQDAQIKRLDRKVVRTLAVAIIGPLIAIGGLVFTGLQWKAAKDQLAVMREQLKDARAGAAQAERDTDRALIVAQSQAKSLQIVAAAARDQLDAAKQQAASLAALAEGNRRHIVVAESQAAALQRQAESLASEVEVARVQAEASRSEAESMVKLAAANEVIAGAANASARATEHVASTAASQLEITDRAWISADAKPSGPVDFLSPANLRHLVDAIRAMGLSTRLRLTLRNTGRSVANDIRVVVRLTFVSPRALIGDDPLDTVAIGTCTAEDATWLGKKALFPGESASVHDDVYAPIAPSDVAAPLPMVEYDLRREVRRVISESSGPPTVEPGDVKRTWIYPQTVEIVAVGCVSYVFGSSLDRHKTWFAFRIGKRTKAEVAPFETWSFDITKDVAERDLFFQRWPYGGNGAD